MAYPRFQAFDALTPYQTQSPGGVTAPKFDFSTLQFDFGTLDKPDTGLEPLPVDVASEASSAFQRLMGEARKPLTGEAARAARRKAMEEELQGGFTSKGLREGIGKSIFPEFDPKGWERDLAKVGIPAGKSADYAKRAYDLLVKPAGTAQGIATAAGATLAPASVLRPLLLGLGGFGTLTLPPVIAKNVREGFTPDVFEKYLEKAALISSLFGLGGKGKAPATAVTKGKSIGEFHGPYPEVTAPIADPFSQLPNIYRAKKPEFFNPDPMGVLPNRYQRMQFEGVPEYPAGGTGVVPKSIRDLPFELPDTPTPIVRLPGQKPLGGDETGAIDVDALKALYRKLTGGKEEIDTAAGMVRIKLGIGQSLDDAVGMEASVYGSRAVKALKDYVKATDPNVIEGGLREATPDILKENFGKHTGIDLEKFINDIRVASVPLRSAINNIARQFGDQAGKIVNSYAKATTIEKFRNLPPASTFDRTRFILPDGTRLTHNEAIHEYGANRVGSSLDEALASGIVRFAHDGAQIASPITTKQAQVLTNAASGMEAFYLDVQGNKPRMSYGSKSIERGDITSSAMLDWVNSHFSDDVVPVLARHREKSTRYPGLYRLDHESGSIDFQSILDFISGKKQGAPEAQGQRKMGPFGPLPEFYQPGYEKFQLPPVTSGSAPPRVDPFTPEPYADPYAPRSIGPLNLPRTYGISGRDFPTGQPPFTPDRFRPEAPNVTMFNQMLPAHLRTKMPRITEPSAGLNDPRMRQAWRDLDPEGLPPPPGERPQPTPVQQHVENLAASPNPEVAATARAVEPEAIQAEKKWTIIDQLTKDEFLITVNKQLDKMGDKGRDIRYQLAKTSQEARRIEAEYGGKWKNIVKGLNRAERENLASVMYGDAPPISPKVEWAAQAGKRMITDPLGQLAVENKVRFKIGDELHEFRPLDQYWPKKPTDPSIFERPDFVESLVKQGLTRERAQRIADHFRETGELLASPQHARRWGIFEWRKDPEVMIEHIGEMARLISRAQHLGPGDISVKGTKINQMIEGSPDPKRAFHLVETQLKGALGLKYTAAQKIARGWGKFGAAYETMTKLSMFYISNFGGMIPMAQHGKWGPLISSTFQALGRGKAIRNLADKSGATVNISLEILNEIKKNRLSGAYGKVFINPGENLMRTIAAGTGKGTAKILHEALKDDPTNKAARSQFQDLMLTRDIDPIIAQGTLTEEQTTLAAGMFSEITQGLAEGRQLPPAWTNEAWFQIPLIFRKMAAQQTKSMKDAIMRNPARNIPVLVGMGLGTGEVIGDVKSGIVGGMRGLAEGLGDMAEGKNVDIMERMGEEAWEAIKTRHEYVGQMTQIEDWWTNRIIADALQGWMLGITGDILQSAFSGRERYLGAISPFAESLAVHANLVTDIPEAINYFQGEDTNFAASKALGRHYLRAIPVIGGGLQRALLPTERQEKGGSGAGDFGTGGSGSGSFKAPFVPTVSAEEQLPPVKAPIAPLSDRAMKNRNIRWASELTEKLRPQPTEGALLPDPLGLTGEGRLPVPLSPLRDIPEITDPELQSIFKEIRRYIPNFGLGTKEISVIMPAIWANEQYKQDIGEPSWAPPVDLVEGAAAVGEEEGGVGGGRKGDVWLRPDVNLKRSQLLENMAHEIQHSVDLLNNTPTQHVGDMQDPQQRARDRVYQTGKLLRNLVVFGEISKILNYKPTRQLPIEPKIKTPSIRFSPSAHHIPR